MSYKKVCNYRARRCQANQQQAKPHAKWRSYSLTSRRFSLKNWSGEIPMLPNKCWTLSILHIFEEFSEKVVINSKIFAWIPYKGSERGWPRLPVNLHDSGMGIPLQTLTKACVTVLCIDIQSFESRIKQKMRSLNWKKIGSLDQWSNLLKLAMEILQKRYGLDLSFQ